ncbi:MAG: hypothetical protein AAGI46_11490 [Planctomycetota bacterium]
MLRVEDDPSVKAPVSPMRLGFLIAAKTAIITTVVGLAGVVLWEEGIEHRVTTKNVGLVEPGLYRSGQISRFMIGPAIDNLELDVIVSLSIDNPDNPHNVAEFEAARAAGVERYHVNLRGDGTGDPTEYVDALAYIVEARKADKTTLVHCWAGSERTGGLTALYRTLIRGETWGEDLVSELRDYGHDVDRGVLIDYLNEHVETIAQSLVDRGVIEALPETLPVFTR